MQQSSKLIIVSAFSDSILMDAARVPSIENDPNPHLQEFMDIELEEDTADDSTVGQYEDEPVEESSADELPEEMPSI